MYPAHRLDWLRGVAAFAVVLTHRAFAFLPVLRTGNQAQLRCYRAVGRFDTPRQGLPFTLVAEPSRKALDLPSIRVTDRIGKGEVSTPTTGTPARRWNCMSGAYVPQTRLAKGPAPTPAPVLPSPYWGRGHDSRGRSAVPCVGTRTIQVPCRSPSGCRTSHTLIPSPATARSSPPT